MADAPLPGIRACVFDAYGTLFDYGSAASACADVLGGRGEALTRLWRDKQMEYTWLRAVQGRHADFRQVTGNGAVSTGKMWVSRPGRMRFEYDPPSPIVLLADSTSVYYWDKQLNEKSKYPLRDTPAWFFLRDPIDFGADVIVTGFQHLGENIVRVTVVERKDPGAGSLTLDFSEKPLALRQWTVVDQRGNLTTVTLSDTRFGVALDPRLFQYQYLFTGSNH